MRLISDFVIYLICKLTCNVQIMPFLSSALNEGVRVSQRNPMVNFSRFENTLQLLRLFSSSEREYMFMV
jgi:hypothetical protein